MWLRTSIFDDWVEETELTAPQKVETPETKACRPKTDAVLVASDIRAKVIKHTSFSDGFKDMSKAL